MADYNYLDNPTPNDGLTGRTDLRVRLLNGYLFFSVVVFGAALWVAWLINKRLQQPDAVESEFVRNIPLILLAAVVVTLIANSIFWVYANSSLIRPIEQLVDYSEVMRWRGHLDPDEKVILQRLGKKPAQIGSLARSLLAVEQEYANRIHELTTLLKTGRVVASSLDANSVIDGLLEQMQQLFGVDRCAVLSLDSRTNQFVMIANRGMGDYTKRYNQAEKPGDLPSMRALKNNAPIQIIDTETDISFIPFRERARNEGFRSILAIPIKTNYAPPATIVIYRSEPYHYSYRELELAISFANNAAFARDNAALFAQTDEQLQEQTRRLEAIIESMQDGLILESLSGEILYCNHMAATWLQAGSEKIVGRDSAELTNPLFEAPLEANKFIETSHRNVDFRIHFFAVTDASGHQIGRGQLWQDITQDKQLDRMKTALLSTASHELRTPLATIKGYASTLLAPDVDWDATAQREFLQTISDETDRLTHLVKNLLEMSRIEAGRLHLSLETYILNDLIAPVVLSFEPTVKERIVANLDPELPFSPIDISRISTVVRNFIENAVKYGDGTTPITLSSYFEHNSVHFTVHNQGDGIPEAHQTQIFDRFYRIDNRLAREKGGVGLGLAICKGFVEAHAGSIWVRNEDDGATFGFSLPVKSTLQSNS